MASPLSCILMECAKAIEGGRLDVADSLLAVIQSLASKEESIWTRKVVKYFAEALVRRAYRIRPPWPLPSLPFLSQPTDYMYEPFYEFTATTSKHAIADALNSGYKRLHIIDFSIMFHLGKWEHLFGDLKRKYGGLQSVLITSIAPKLSKHTDYLRKNRAGAEEANVELRQLIWNSPDDIVNCISKLRRKMEDEIVVVNWNFVLHRLLAQDGATEQVLSKVKDLGADIMVIVEQEANLNSPDLSERLEQSFQYYSHVFELLEKLEKIYGGNVFWEMYFRRQIGNVVACEGVDRVELIESFAQWQNRLSLAGFYPVPQQANEFKEDFLDYFEEMVDQDYLEAYGIEEKEGHNIVLSRHGCPIAVASVWKVTDPPQFSGGLYTMQDTVDDSEGMDTVDDSEGMWSSSESEDDEENDSLVCIMADRNLWSTQGSSMNRIAASAKLYDILEYTCDLHELRLGMTWISCNKGGNTDSKGKRILGIDDSARFVNHCSMEQFVDGYARHRLEEGKGIAGKALQSNIHIQHDISLLDPAEFPNESNYSNWLVRNQHAAFAIRLTSTHPCMDDYELEFLLPISMKETSERELLINKILRTLQRKCSKLWKVGIREVNETSSSEVRLDDKKMPNIPHEETREPLEQQLIHVWILSGSCKYCEISFSQVKGLSTEELAARNDLVLALPDRIQAIPDGTAAAPKQTGGWGTSAPRAEIKFDSDGQFDNEYFQETETSSQFRQEYKMRKMKQDQGLDMISDGLDTLKNMAHDMNEEVDRQVPLMDEIDTKVDKAAADLKNTNVRLKDTVNQLRSSRNFCIDIVQVSMVTIGLLECFMIILFVVFVKSFEGNVL